MTSQLITFRFELQGENQVASDTRVTDNKTHSVTNGVGLVFFFCSSSPISHFGPCHPVHICASL